MLNRKENNQENEEGDKVSVYGFKSVGKYFSLMILPTVLMNGSDGQNTIKLQLHDTKL